MKSVIFWLFVLIGYIAVIAVDWSVSNKRGEIDPKYELILRVGGLNTQLGAEYVRDQFIKANSGFDLEIVSAIAKEGAVK